MKFKFMFLSSRLLFLLNLFFCLNNFTIAQGQQTFFISGIVQAPGDFVITHDNGYLIGGQLFDTLSGQLDQCGLVKLDSAGNQEWVKMYDDMGHDSWITSVHETSDTGIIFCGKPDGSINPHSFLVKTTSNGNVIWFRKFTYPNHLNEGPLICIESLDHNNLVVANLNNGMSNILKLVKIDQNGNVLWEYNYSDTIGNLGFCKAMVQTVDSDIVLTGGYNNNCFLFRLDKNGNPKWLKGFSDSFQMIPANCILSTPDQGFLIGCSDNPFSCGDALVIKTDSFGDTLWTKIFTGPECHSINDVKQCADSNYIFTGTVGDNNSHTQKLFLIKLDQNGDTLWTRMYAAQPMWNLIGNKIQIDANGNIISLCNYDFHSALIKTDSSGNMSCYETTEITNLVQRNIITSTFSCDKDSIPGTSPILIGFQQYSTVIEFDCSSTSIDYLSNSDAFDIYPNPSQCEIYFKSSETIKQINIYDLTGKKVKEYNFPNSPLITGLNAGLYLIQVIDAKGVFYKKLTIER